MTSVSSYAEIPRMMGRNVVRVLLVDDHERVRMGLTALLSTSDDIEVIGEAENGQVAMQQVEKLQPDVVLMDLIMPGTDGVTATKWICQHFPQTKIIILSSTVEYDMVQAALKAGAVAYLYKSVRYEELVGAIHNAYIQ